MHRQPAHAPSDLQLEVETLARGHVHIRLICLLMQHGGRGAPGGLDTKCGGGAPCGAPNYLMVGLSHSPNGGVKVLWTKPVFTLKPWLNPARLLVFTAEFKF